GVRAGLPVGTEAGLERFAGGGGTQAGVAVHVRGTDAGLPDHREGVVLLQEQLAAGVEADPAPAAGLVEQLTGPGDDAAQRGVPVGLHQPAAVADQRPGQPVGAVVGLPAVDVLGIEPALVDPVGGPAAHADDPPVPYPDVHRVAVGVQHGC